LEVECHTSFICMCTYIPFLVLLIPIHALGNRKQLLGFSVPLDGGFWIRVVIMTFWSGAPTTRTGA
jgi:hypothetical protein